MLEKEIEKRLGERVKRAGGLYLKFVSPGNDGVPDRIVVHDGRVVFVELKAEKGRLSALQARQIDRLRRAGAQVRILFGLAQAEDFARELEGGDAQ